MLKRCFCEHYIARFGQKRKRKITEIPPKQVHRRGKCGILSRYWKVFAGAAIEERKYFYVDCWH